jgi:hypothetical protein
VREGAGDTGYTVAKALASLRDETLRLDRQTLVIVDEAGMVGTDDLRQLLTATTKAAAKTVLVGAGPPSRRASDAARSSGSRIRHTSESFCAHGRSEQSWANMPPRAFTGASWRVAARRLSDGARAAFSGDYLRQHITHGYAVTVHSAQGVTADTTHAVLGETTSRALLYVALTRGRESNAAYLYERKAGETEHEHAQPDGLHIARRGSGREAAQLVRAIIATRDEQAHTAHHIAAQAPDCDHLPDRVRRLLDRRARAVHRRHAAYQNWCHANAEQLAERQRWIDQHLSRSQHSRERGLDYGLGL